jgi:hypothetical protein
MIFIFFLHKFYYNIIFCFTNIKIKIFVIFAVQSALLLSVYLFFTGGADESFTSDETLLVPVFLILGAYLGLVAGFFVTNYIGSSYKKHNPASFRMVFSYADSSFNNQHSAGSFDFLGMGWNN